MTVVVAQGGLIDEGYNAVRLAMYAQQSLQGECSFWGVRDPIEPINEACNPLMTMPERAQIAFYLGEAQDEIEQVVGYPLSPRWFTDEMPVNCLVKARRGHVIEMGVKATSDIALGAFVDHATDPAIIGPLATAVTDAGEIHVYHPGTDFEIDPSEIYIAGGMVLISIPRCRLVIDSDNPEDGWDYTDVGTCAASTPTPGVFECEVDVKRVYNDPTTQAILVWPHHSNLVCTCGCGTCLEYTHEACGYVRDGEGGLIDIRYANESDGVWTATCGCFCTQPELVRIYYRAGAIPLTKQAQDAIIHLAHAKMPRPSCGCGILRDKWDADRALIENPTIEQSNNPFGLEFGAWKSWQFAQAMRLHRPVTM